MIEHAGTGGRGLRAIAIVAIGSILVASSTAAPAAVVEETFIGIGDAEVVDFSSGTECTAAFFLRVEDSSHGPQAILRFLPACHDGNPINAWQIHWPLHPIAFALVGDWESGYAGDVQFLLFRGHLEIGSYGNGLEIPVQGYVLNAGPLEAHWSGTVTDVNKLI